MPTTAQTFSVLLENQRSRTRHALVDLSDDLFTKDPSGTPLPISRPASRWKRRASGDETRLKITPGFQLPNASGWRIEPLPILRFIRIPHGVTHAPRVEEVASAAMSSPDPLLTIGVPAFTEASRCPRFEMTHHLLGREIAARHNVNMIRTDVHRVERPFFIAACLENRFFNDRSFYLFENS